jgi:putative transposase
MDPVGDVTEQTRLNDAREAHIPWKQWGPISQHFRPRRHRFSAPAYRQELQKRFQVWQEITTPALAA